MRIQVFNDATRYLVLRCLLGGVLAIAASLKGYPFLIESPESHSFSDWLTFGIVVPLEVILAVWLLTGFHLVMGWHAALITFSCFAAVALIKAVAGDTSCGCFGRLSVNPGYVLLLDVSSVIALVVIRPRAAWNSRAPRRRPALALALVLATAVPFTLVFGRQATSSLSFDGQPIGTNQVILLEPEDWIGRTLPLFPYIDVSEQLTRGHWLVVLYRPDCPSCQALIRKQEPAWRAMSHEESGPRVALIRTSDSAETPPSRPDNSIVRGHLSTSHQWFVKLPVLMWIDDGSVTNVQQGDS